MENKRENRSDSELLEYIFMKYRNGMYAVAFSILHDEYQAEDAVGDACEKFIPYVGRCRVMEEQKIKTLLTRFVKNAAIDIYRKNRREQGNVSVEEQEWIADAYRPIEAYMKSLQYKELIQEIRKVLPAQYWEVVCLRYFEGMPVHEISITAAAVSVISFFLLICFLPLHFSVVKSPFSTLSNKSLWRASSWKIWSQKKSCRL